MRKRPRPVPHKTPPGNRIHEHCRTRHRAEGHLQGLRPGAGQQGHLDVRGQGHDPRHRGRKRRGQIDADVDPLRLLQGRRGRDLHQRQKTEIPDSQAAIRAGIGMVHQHFKLVENFTVVENVILGAEDGAMLRPSSPRRANRSRSCPRNTASRSTPTRSSRTSASATSSASKSSSALPPRRYPDPRRAHGRADAGRGRSACSASSNG
jgi:hypothetical protein